MAWTASSTHCAEATIDGDDGVSRGRAGRAAGGVGAGAGAGFTELFGAGVPPGGTVGAGCGAGGGTACGAHPHNTTMITRCSTAYRKIIAGCLCNDYLL